MADTIVVGEYGSVAEIEIPMPFDATGFTTKTIRVNRPRGLPPAAWTASTVATTYVRYVPADGDFGAAGTYGYVVDCVGASGRRKAFGTFEVLPEPAASP